MRKVLYETFKNEVKEKIILISMYFQLFELLIRLIGWKRILKI